MRPIKDKREPEIDSCGETGVYRETGSGGPEIWIAVKELLTDILGAFLPGLCFAAALGISLFLLMEKIWNFGLIGYLRQAAPFGIVLFCVISYAMGSVFYRKDIKEPDRASALYIYRTRIYKKERFRPETDVVKHEREEWENREARKEYAINIDRKAKQKWYKHLFRKENSKLTEENMNVDFPYLSIKIYLENRNLRHLAEQIPVDENDSFEGRSKMFVNILKLRIHKCCPAEMPEIIKNEAHVRLMNSLWYAAKAVLVIAPVSLVLGVCLEFVHALKEEKWIENLLSFITGNVASGPKCLPMLLFSLILIVLGCYIRHSIKQYFHYQRVREIVMVLETAWILSRKHPEIFSM